MGHDCPIRPSRTHRELMPHDESDRQRAVDSSQSPHRCGSIRSLAPTAQAFAESHLDSRPHCDAGECGADQGPADGGAARDNGERDIPATSGTPHGPWLIRSSQVAYQDPWVQVRRDCVIRPDGRDGTYAIVAIKRGVCVIAIDDSGTVHLTREFHYAVGRVTIEGVSGGIEPGDTAEQTAHRELREELGISAAVLQPLGKVDPFTSSIDSPTLLFVALGLSFGQPSPEGTELIERVTMTIDEAVNAVMQGEITHAPTCVALLKWVAIRDRPNGQ